MRAVAPDTAALLEALDGFRDVSGTLPLFDAVGEQDGPAVQRALAKNLRHPLSAEVERWLEARGYEGPVRPTLEEVLSARGISDLELYLDELDRQVRGLEEGNRELLVGRLRAERVASAYAGVVVMLLAAAVLGWASALDILHIVGEKPVMVDDLDKPSGAPSPVGGR